MKYKSTGAVLAVFLIFWLVCIFLLKAQKENLVFPVLALGVFLELLHMKSRLRGLGFLVLSAGFAWILQSFEAKFHFLKIYDAHPLAPSWLFLLWMLFLSCHIRAFPKLFSNKTLGLLYAAYSLPSTYYFLSKLKLVKIYEPLYQSLFLNSVFSVLIFAWTQYLLRTSIFKRGKIYD